MNDRSMELDTRGKSRSAGILFNQYLIYGLSIFLIAFILTFIACWFTIDTEARFYDSFFGAATFSAMVFAIAIFLIQGLPNLGAVIDFEFDHNWVDYQRVLVNLTISNSSPLAFYGDITVSRTPDPLYDGDGYIEFSKNEKGYKGRLLSSGVSYQTITIGEFYKAYSYSTGGSDYKKHDTGERDIFVTISPKSKILKKMALTRHLQVPGAEIKRQLERELNVHLSDDRGFARRKDEISGLVIKRQKNTQIATDASSLEASETNRKSRIQMMRRRLCELLKNHLAMGKNKIANCAKRMRDFLTMTIFRSILSISICLIVSSFCLFYFSPALFDLEPQTGLWNSMGLSISAASFFIAIMIFWIQNYPELDYSLLIHSQTENHKGRHITMILTYTNSNFSVFEGNLSLEFPQIIEAKGSFYSRVDDNFKDLVQMRKNSGDCYEVLYEPIDRSSSLISENTTSYLHPVIYMRMLPKSYLIRSILGNKENGFHPDQVQDAIGQVLIEASNGSKRGIVLEA